VEKDSITENPGRLYVVRSGSCQVQKKNHERPILVYPDLGPCSIFGYIDLVIGNPYIEKVIANENSSCLSIIEPYFLNVFLQHYPEIVLKHVFKDLARVLYEQVTQELEM